jgi:hypothetical protein
MKKLQITLFESILLICIMVGLYLYSQSIKNNRFQLSSGSEPDDIQIIDTKTGAVYQKYQNENLGKFNEEIIK